MKLNLGRGGKRWPGFVNVDRAGSGAEVECDIRKLPYADAVVDEVHAIHVFEHFYLHEAAIVLAEWRRVLRDGGLLVLEVPCWDKVADILRAGEMRPQLVRWPLHGDPRTHRGEEDVHKWCWSASELSSAVKAAGFKNVCVSEPLFHVAMRDMRLEANK